MNAKRLLLLVVVAAIAVTIAIALRNMHGPRPDSDQQNKPLLPALRDHVNDVNAITLTGAGNKVIVTLTRSPSGWTIAERSGYPADITEIRGLLVKLGRSTLIDPKTTNAQHYADIGVDDVAGKDAKGVRVDIAGLSSTMRLIVGTYSPQSGGTFVRRDGEAQSWLASGDLSIGKTVTDWAKRDIVDIPADRVASVTLSAPDGKTLKLYKQPGEAAFRAADMPAGRRLDQGIATAVAATLSGLRIDDVLPAKDAPPSAQSHNAEYVALDGTKIDAMAWAKDGKDYAQFQAALDSAAAQKRVADEQAKAKAAYEAAVSASKPTATSTADPAEPKSPVAADHAPAGVPEPLAVSDPAADQRARLDAIGKDVDTLNRSFAGWTYVLPSYLFGNLTKTINDVLVPLKPKTPAVAEPASRTHS